jgi:hypothetical protein
MTTAVIEHLNSVQNNDKNILALPVLTSRVSAKRLRGESIHNLILEERRHFGFDSDFPVDQTGIGRVITGTISSDLISCADSPFVRNL